ncbi:MAG: hypothetical protein AW09_003560 [Candidatus Accumulibacter phosphatis]|uniref:Uncharacterized protein n=1 Tax=Candidatus Accumulibacter phosphatis TaxID=327160 RepID=A0A080LSG6_9PROT|nr:MAG: hypothetical protein AW09_003560 [Candidatus Accumulibacter phosphatis]
MHDLAVAAALPAIDQRRGGVADAQALFDAAAQVFESGFVVHVQSFTIDAFSAEEVAWQGNACLALDGQGGGPFNGVIEQRVDRQAGVGDAVHEGRVGAVLEQAAHQVCQQVFVAADRGIDATGASQLVPADDLVVEFFAHAVQALVFPFVAAAGTDRNLGDGRQGVCVVRGEGRVEGLRVGEQASGTGQIREVARRLAGEYRVIAQATLLRELDLGVPVSTLAQANHQTSVGAVGEVGEPVDERQRTLLVGLDGQPEAIPAGQFGVGGECFDQVERHFQTIDFFGVDREADVARLGTEREFLDDRPQFVANATLVGDFVTRMQRRELDRDRRRFVCRAAGGGVANRPDRRAVGLEVTQRVGAAARRFSEHVVGVAVAGLFGVAGALQRFMDVAAHHELLAENAHGGDHRLPDHRFAGARDDALEGAAQIAVLVVEIDDAAGEHQRPGAGIDESTVRGAEPLLPLGTADLVANQTIDGRRIGDAQQRFGEAHQHHAFARREVVGGQEGIDASAFEATVAHRLHQWRCPFTNALLFGRGEARQRDQLLDDLGFVDTVIFAQTLAE